MSLGGVFGAAHINLGLAAARDPVQQKGPAGIYGVDDLLLGGRGLRAHRLLGQRGVRHTAHLRVVLVDPAFF